MIAVVIVLASIDVPAPKTIAINTKEVLGPRPSGKVILGDIPTPIRLEPRLILDLILGQVIAQQRQSLIFDVGSTLGEGRVIQSPERAEFTEGGQRMVHEILIGTGQAGENDPVHVSLGGSEGDIDVFLAVVCASFGDGSRGPLQIGRSAVCGKESALC